jgi:hypothetical protein
VALDDHHGGPAVVRQVGYVNGGGSCSAGHRRGRPGNRGPKMTLCLQRLGG